MTTVHDQRDAVRPTPGRIGALAGRLDPREPHLIRGPFARWPRATDGVLALVVFVASLTAVAVSQLDDGEPFTAGSITDHPAGALVLIGVAAAALWWRRGRPVEVTMSVLAVMVVWALAGYGDGQDLALVVAVYSVGRYCTDPRHGPAVVAAAVAVGLLASVIDTHQRIDVLPAVLLTTLPWYVGRRVRNRGAYLALLQERAERLQAEQHARARAAVAAERSRIARELHDVVAHEVSMMTVQAGAAKTIARDDPDAAVEAMGDVEQAGRRALRELRHLLGVLRHGADDPEHLGPQPGLANVPALVAELRDTGAHVTLDLADLPDHLATAVDLSAFRIVQESFTNIIRHAGPHPIVEVVIGLDGDTLVIDVTNTTVAARPHLPASGYGIVGMRERVNLLGGTLTAGAQAPGRFHVHARLPVEPGPS